MADMNYKSNPEVELASIRQDINGNLSWSIAFYIPRFSFLDKLFGNWQFFQNGSMLIDSSIKLSHYRAALIQMKNQLEEWIGLMDNVIEKYGDIEPDK